MTDIIFDNIYLALLFPLWIFLIIMCGRFFNVYVNKKIIHLLTLFSSLTGILLCGISYIKLGQNSFLETQIPFIKINNFIISLGIYIDKPALIFATTLFVISFLVQLFSVSYMKQERKTYRFYAFLNFFNFAMAGFFFSPNLYQSYIFWELAGVISYLLIGFEYNKELKSIASKKVFIINRIGDTAFLGGILICSYYMFEYANSMLTTLAYTDMTTISTLIYAYTSTPLFYIICGLFILSAVVKSAQFPFNTWLIDAMEAKLPVSALLHSATLVACGIFLLLRLSPFFTLIPVILKIVAAIGLSTALICSISASAQNHPKKVLAYSTSAQFGLLFFSIGILNLKATILFFIAHALVKSSLFLCLPNPNEKWELPKFVLFILNGLSLAGILFAPMMAKELIDNSLSRYESIVFATISALTAFYIIRIAFITLKEHGLDRINKTKIELISISSFLLINAMLFILLVKTCGIKISTPFIMAILASILTSVLYKKNWTRKIPILYELSFNGFYLDKFYSIIITKIYENFTNLMNFIDTKIFSNHNIILKILKISVKIFEFIENKFMNGIVKFVSKSSLKISQINTVGQSGNIQQYNTYAFVIITLILTCLVISFPIIIRLIGG